MPDYQITIRRAFELHQQGRLQEAGELYQELLRRDAGDPRALHGLGLVMHQLGRQELAASLIARAIEVAGEVASYHHNYGEVLLAAGKAGQAVPAFQRALQLDAQRASTQASLGAAYTQLGRYEEAVDYIQRALSNGAETAENFCRLGVARSAHGDAQAAVTCLHQAIALNEGPAEAFRFLGEALLAAESLDHALAAYNQAITLQNDFARAYYGRGVVQARLGEVTAAAESLQKAIDLEPDYAAAVRALAAIEHRLERWEQALQRYRQAIELGEDNIEVRLDMAVAAERANDIEEAIRQRLEVRKHLPESIENEFNLAALNKEKPPQIAPAEMVISTFNRYASTYEQHLLENLHYRGPEILKTAVDSCLPQDRNRLRILDLGCGTGLCGEQLFERKSYMVGIDLAEKMIEKARAKNIYDELHVSDLNSYLQTASGFDIVLAGDCFTYIGELSPVHALVYQALNKEGLFAYTLEIADRTEGIQCNEYQLARGRRYCHSPDYIRRMADEHDFEVSLLQEHVLRYENKKAVRGMLVALQRA